LAQAIFEPNPFLYKHSNFSQSSHSSHLPAYKDGTECSETSAYKIQTPGNYPAESTQHSEHGGSLKSRTLLLLVLCSLSVTFHAHQTEECVALKFSDGHPHVLTYCFTSAWTSSDLFV